MYISKLMNIWPEQHEQKYFGCGCPQEDGETAQQLRVHTALTEDVHLVPSIQVGQLRSRDTWCFCPAWHMHSYTHTHTKTHACTLNKIIKILFISALRSDLHEPHLGRRAWVLLWLTRGQTDKAYPMCASRESVTALSSCSPPQRIWEWSEKNSIGPRKFSF